MRNDAGYEARRRRRAERRRAVRRRRMIAGAAVLAVLAAAGYALAGVGSGGRDAGPATHSSGTHGSSSGSSSVHSAASTKTATRPPVSTDDGAADRTFTMTAVGDTMLGNTPEVAPSPSTYFDQVKTPLTSGAQIVFGNLEGTLTNESAGKCGADTANCYQFRAPPSYARALRESGFTILNNANNHSYDFGPAGQEQTVHALHEAGIAQTGLPGEITVVRAHGVKVAFLGFAPYSDTASLLDIPRARELVRKARTMADVVVVYMHAGAEGSQYQHVTGQDEEYFGEDRGDPQEFAEDAIDAGASLVIASGPHVLRGMQFYRRHLIAYSLGNFAGYSNYDIEGVLGETAILRVKLTGKGRFVSGQITPVEMVGKGQPVPGGSAISTIAELSRADFGSHAATISAGGGITPPT